MGYTIRVTGLDELRKALEGFHEAYTREARDFLTKAALAVQGEVQPRTPHADVNTVRYSTGNLMRSIGVNVDAGDPPTHARVGTAQPYGPFIETGKRNDPRARRNPVFRRLGPAWMFRDGAKAAGGAIEKLAAAMGRRLTESLRG